MTDKETVLDGFLPNWGKGLSGYLFCPQAMPGAQMAMHRSDTITHGTKYDNDHVDVM